MSMPEYNDNYPDIRAFTRGDHSHINFNYVWDTGLSTWRPLSPSDYGDVTLSNSPVTNTTNIDATADRIGISGSDGVIIGAGGALPVTDNGGSLTVDFDRPVPVTDNDGSLTVDGNVAITGEPVWVTGDFKLDEPIEVHGNVAITGQPVWVTGEFKLEGGVTDIRTGTQIGISGLTEVHGNVSITGQPVWVTGNFASSSPEITVVGVSGYKTYIVGHSGEDGLGIRGHRYTAGENYIGSGIFLKPYTLHSYQVVQKHPNIGADGAIFVIETTNFEQENWQPIYAAKIDSGGNTTLPDYFGWGGDGLTGGLLYRDQWNFKYARVVIQNYTSGTFYISEHHTP